MKYYCIKQHDITDCGAACLATISKQYGLNLSISKIREAAGTDKQGTGCPDDIASASCTTETPKISASSDICGSLPFFFIKESRSREAFKKSSFASADFNNSAVSE